MENQPVEPGGNSTRAAVFEVAIRLLDETRTDEGFTDVTRWVTGSQIANEIGIDKDTVLEALTSLGDDGWLRVKSAAGNRDIEVLGAESRRGIRGRTGLGPSGQG